MQHVLEARSDDTRLDKLRDLLDHTWRYNQFYRNKWLAAGLERSVIRGLDSLREYPFTTRSELLQDNLISPPIGSNHAAPLAEFKQFVQSSGTTGNPIVWPDTERNWQWVGECSARLHQISGVRAGHTVLFMTDLGRASGPWVILSGVKKLGCSCRTCGSAACAIAVQWIARERPQVLIGKPAALLTLGNALTKTGLQASAAGIERLILTGPGSTRGSAVREQLESIWRAPAFDRYGLTEAGSVAAECESHNGGLHLLDSEFLAEIIDSETGEPLAEDRTGELVLTNLGRVDRPIIRYRTGDRTSLRRDFACGCGRVGTFLPRGILGRLH